MYIISAMLNLQAKERKEGVKPQSLREEGLLPVVLYGPKEKTVSLIVNQKEFGILWRETGESTVFTLDTPSGKKNVLIHEIAFHPVKDTPEHVDFYAIEAGKEVKVSIPIDFVGVSNAVKSLSGNLVKVLYELPVRGLPEDLPQNIEVDISVLAELDSQVIASDITLPKGVVLNVDGDSPVASISVQKEEEEEEVVADLDSVEVEQKGKKEGEGEGTAEGEADAKESSE